MKEYRPILLSTYFNLIGKKICYLLSFFTPMTLTESVWLLMPRLICDINTQTSQLNDINSRIKRKKCEITASYFSIVSKKNLIQYLLRVSCYTNLQIHHSNCVLCFIIFCEICVYICKLFTVIKRRLQVTIVSAIYVRKD